MVGCKVVRVRQGRRRQRRLLYLVPTLLSMSLSFLPTARGAEASASSTPLPPHVPRASELDPPLHNLQTTIAELSALVDEQQIKSDDSDSSGGADAESPPPSERLSSRASHLAERTASLIERIAKLNRGQIQHLVRRLNATYEAEVDRRAAWDEKFASCLASSSSSAGDDDVASSSSGTSSSGSCSLPANDRQHIPKLLMETVLNQTIIMSKSERDLEKWTVGLVSESINTYTEERINSLKGNDNDVAPTSANPDYAADDEGCAGLSPVASIVYTSLDSQSYPGGLKVFDHATLVNGGSVVYGEAPDRQLFTSKPYSIPDANSSDDVRIGEVWWRRYIPEDWEFVLDQLTGKQWVKTKVNDLVCQKCLCHVISTRNRPHSCFPYLSCFTNTPQCSSFSYVRQTPIRKHGFSAESILQSDSDLGVCYPISLEQKSRVTIRLAYPILLTGISISLNYCGSFAPMINSTDLSVAVEGYQPCWLSIGDDKEREACERTGFDSRGIQLGNFDHQASSRSKNTFCISSRERDGLTQASIDGADEGGDESASSGQCTVQYEDDGPKSSCQDDSTSATESDAMPSLISGRLLSGDEEAVVVEAVGIIFHQSLDWDCTCIHSIRVHGEPVTR